MAGTRKMKARAQACAASLPARPACAGLQRRVMEWVGGCFRRRERAGRDIRPAPKLRMAVLESLTIVTVSGVVRARAIAASSASSEEEAWMVAAVFGWPLKSTAERA